MEKTTRNYSFDFLKILATVAIVFHHFQQITGVKYDNFINFFGDWFNWGYLVEFFFILSGYFMYRYIPKIQEGKITLLEWWKKRAIRLLPMVAVSVIAFEIILYTYNSLYGIKWWNTDLSIWGSVIAMLGIQTGWGFLDPLINNPIWYVSVLIACYLIFYVFTALSAKINCKAAYFYVFFILLGIGIATYNINLPFLNLQMGRGYYSFFFGLLLAAYLNKYGVKKKEIIASLICIASFIVLCIVAPNYASVNHNYILTFIVYPAIVMLFETNIAKRIFKHRVWGTLSGISFEVYLWHLPLLLLSYVVIKWFNLNIAFESLGGMLVFLLISCAVGTLMYFAVERPVMKLFTERKKKNYE